MSVEIIKHKNYDFILIKQNNFEVNLCNQGASIYYLKLGDKYLTSAQENLDSYLSDGYYGKTIGRVCNRLPGNKINIDNIEYVIEDNEDGNTLHGGKSGLDSRKFNYEIFEGDESTKVIFSYLSPDLESGFPGNMPFKVIYTILKNKPSLKIEFLASTDKKTMCSLTNHAYYTLGEESNLELKLTIYAHRFLHPNPKDLLPVEVKEVDEIMDFSEGKKIGRFINEDYLMNSKSKGYDHYFYFDNVDITKPNCLLESESLKMEVYTDFSGMQIYSDNYETNEKFLGSNCNIRKSIAIEPSESQADLHFLDEDENYYHFIELKFIEK